uniref:B30.2/SPRY domain-containing protein n=1 Tax=Parastrongyloides trichosuri TaxID=131310 RepID=A0A0N5A3K4_PARTI
MINDTDDLIHEAENHLYEGRINFALIDHYPRAALNEAIIHYSSRRFNERTCYDPCFPSNLLRHLGLTQDDFLSLFDDETVKIFERFIIAGRISKKEIPLPPEALGFIENRNKCLFTNRLRNEESAYAVAKNTMMNSEADIVPLQQLAIAFKALQINCTILNIKMGKAEKQYFRVYRSIKDRYLNYLSRRINFPENIRELVGNVTNFEMSQFLSPTNDVNGEDFNNRSIYPDQPSISLPTLAEDNINGFIMHLLLKVFKWEPTERNLIFDENGVHFYIPTIIKRIKSQYGNIHRFYNIAYSEESIAVQHMSPIDFDWNHKNNDRLARSKLAIVDRSAVINFVWAASAVACMANVELRKGMKVFWQFKIFGKRDCTSIMFGIATHSADLWSREDLSDLIGIDNNSWGINHRGYGIHGGKKKPVTKSFPKEWSGEYVGLMFNGFGKYGTLTYFLRGRNMGIIFDKIPLDETLYPVVSSTGQFTEFRINKCLQTFIPVPELKTVIRGKILDLINSPSNIDNLTLCEHEKAKLKQMWDEDELLHDFISGHTHHYPNFRQ